MAVSMDPVHVARRARLRWLLENPPRPLKMRYWVDADSVSCVDYGTAACALGTAALDPELIRQGLSVVPTYWPNEEFMGYAPHFEDETGSEAGALFFGLLSDEAFELFVYGYDKPISKVTAADVLANLDKIEGRASKPEAV